MVLFELKWICLESKAYLPPCQYREYRDKNERTIEIFPSALFVLFVKKAHLPTEIQGGKLQVGL